LAAASAGSSIAAKTAMMVMTTSSSMSVNPRDEVLRGIFTMTGLNYPAPTQQSSKKQGETLMCRFDVL
jgi:hypothetical protein